MTKNHWVCIIVAGTIAYFIGVMYPGLGQSGINAVKSATGIS